MTRIAFLDRDGTLIEEPADYQIDSYEKFRLVAGVIPALISLQAAGYALVMVSNQDGLGTPAFPKADFDGPQQLLMQILESQGITFREILIDPSFEHEARCIDGIASRKPGVGMVMSYLRDRSIDLANSVVIGDRETDMQLAQNLGCIGLRIGPGFLTWPEIIDRLTTRSRHAQVQRNTGETRIDVTLNLDRFAAPVIATGLGFFDHMLEQLGKHGGFELQLRCAGDLHIDEHHTVEDCALALGQAVRQALGDKRGIKRYAFTLPMDESMATAVLDVSGRPGFFFEGAFAREMVGDLPTELVPHFFRSFCEAAGLNLHLSMRGENAHHQVEACFKAVARVLREALTRDGGDVPSTKGVL